MTDDLTRDFKGIWIPKEIWLDERLNTVDKIILLEVDSLDSSEEGCYASNEYLSEFCKCSESTISNSINKLIKLGYIEVKKFDGRKRYLKSRLLNFKRQTLKNQKADYENLRGINIDNNIINNKIYNIYGEFKNVKLTDDEYKKLEEKNLLPYIEKLSSYIASKGKKYKSHYATILTWSRKEQKEDIIPEWFNKDTNVNVSNEDQKEMENILNNLGE